MSRMARIEIEIWNSREDKREEISKVINEFGLEVERQGMEVRQLFENSTPKEHLINIYSEKNISFGEEEYIKEFSEGIWSVNENYCVINIRITDLEDPPYMDYNLTEYDYNLYKEKGKDF